MDFRTFMGQILIYFFWSFSISNRIKTVEKPFVIIFWGSDGISTRATVD